MGVAEQGPGACPVYHPRHQGSPSPEHFPGVGGSWRYSSAAGRRPRPSPSLAVKHWVCGSGRAENWNTTFPVAVEHGSQGCAGPGHCLPQHCRGPFHGLQWIGGPSHINPELALRPCNKTPQGEQAQGPDSFYRSRMSYFLTSVQYVWFMKMLQLSDLFKEFAGVFSHAI